MKYKLIGAVIAVLFLIGVAGSVLVLTAPEQKTVRITQGGETLYTIDLSTADDAILTIGATGMQNTVEIRDHRIRVKDADCPDKTCVNMGWLSSSAMPIVCLPHQLVIEFTGSTDGVDAVTR